MVYKFEVEVPLSQSSIENMTGALIDDKDYELLGESLQEVSISKSLYVVGEEALALLVKEGLTGNLADIRYEEVFALESHLSNAHGSVPVSLLKPLTSLIEEIPTLLLAASLEGSLLRFVQFQPEEN
jgi:HEAT repeat protein